MLHRRGPACGTRCSVHREPGTISGPEGGQASPKSGHRHLQSLARGKEASSLGGASSPCGLTSQPRHSWRVDRNVDALGGGWVVSFLLASTRLADTADDTRGGQEQQGGGHQGNDAQPHQDAHHLRSVPHDRRPGVAEFVPARAFVVMSEENVIVQAPETEPAECVLTLLAHHLGTAFVALDVHPAHGALLNGGFGLWAKERPALRGQGERLALSTGGIRVPSILATGAEFQVA